VQGLLNAQYAQTSQSQESLIAQIAISQEVYVVQTSTFIFSLTADLYLDIDVKFALFASASVVLQWSLSPSDSV